MEDVVTGIAKPSTTSGQSLVVEPVTEEGQNGRDVVVPEPVPIVVNDNSHKSVKLGQKFRTY
jgi:hypothetical protein